MATAEQEADISWAEDIIPGCGPDRYTVGGDVDAEEVLPEWELELLASQE